MEKISIEQFNQYPGAGPKPNPAIATIREMEAGTAMIIDHFGSCGRQENGYRSCSMTGAISVISRSQELKRFSMRHLPDGRVAVACFPKDPVVG